MSVRIQSLTAVSDDTSTMAHGAWNDSFSCGTIMANTTKHATMGTALWKEDRSVAERMQWLFHQANSRQGRDTNNSGVRI